MRRFLLLLALVVGPVVAAVPTLSLAQAPVEFVRVEVSDSPLVVADGGKISMAVSLAEAADLRLLVEDFDGRTVRRLFEGRRGAGLVNQGWFGRDAAGEWVPPGPYRIVATATSDGRVERADAWVTVADRAVYPLAPDLITVAIDPGHGGDHDGAVGTDGTREADLNLDIGLRLARMLEGAGVNVVLTRMADVNVNEPPEDRTGDGIIDLDDELAARPDLANDARADLFLSIHNNTAVNDTVGGPSTFFYDERPFGSRNARLAGLVQAEMVAVLSEAVSGGWEPHDHGALIYPYYVLRGFDPPRLRRPTQMPGVLSEGLFLSNPRELALLRRPAVRAAMAGAYYDAIGKYLARRGDHVGYELISGPSQTLLPGQATSYWILLGNKGNEAIDGWRLRVLAVGTPERYVSRIRDALTVGEVEVPRLPAGESVALEVAVTAPATGEWTLLFDARDERGARAAGMGSPPLQLLLLVAEPEPTPLASSAAPVDPSPDASAGYRAAARQE